VATFRCHWILTLDCGVGAADICAAGRRCSSLFVVVNGHCGDTGSVRRCLFGIVHLDLVPFRGRTVLRASVPQPSCDASRTRGERIVSCNVPQEIYSLLICHREEYPCLQVTCFSRSWSSSRSGFSLLTVNRHRQLESICCLSLAQPLCVSVVLPETFCSHKVLLRSHH
jgi:hypothetical protein